MENLIKWIRIFLVGRKQRVVLNGCSSAWSTVNSGIYITGFMAILGPLLFSLYVNDIPSFVNSPILLFADDTKIYRSIKCRDDYLQLQCDFWCTCGLIIMWQLKLNIYLSIYCYILVHLTLMGIMSYNFFHRYCQGFWYFDGVTIEVSCSHIYGGSYKANCLLGIIKKSFE